MNRAGMLKMSLKRSWIIFLGISLSVMSMGWVAFGATYNFYFNNTEQGPNSTATPSLTVSDGKATGNQPGPTPSGMPIPASLTEQSTVAPAAAAAVQPAGTSVAQVSPAALELRSEHRVFRLTAGGAMNQGQGRGDDFGETGVAPMLAIGIQPWRSFGFTVFGGRFSDGPSLGQPLGYLGGDLEVTPVHFGSGKWEDVIEAKVLVGASTLYRSRDNWVTLHAGARLNLNVSESTALTSSFRMNAGYKMLDAGISFKL